MDGFHCLRGKLTALAWIVAGGALAGLVYVALLANVGKFPFTLQAARNGLINGATITGILGTFEIFVWHAQAGAPLRRLPFPVRVASKTLVYGLVIAATLTTYNTWLLAHTVEVRDPWLYIRENLARDTLFSMAVVLLFQFVMQMRRLIGGRVLTNIVLGRYTRPREETRLFLFVDIADSTAIAHRLGDLETHALISRVFFDLDAVIARYGGEVHRYVGDQVVVTWPLEAGMANGRCLRCALEMRRLLERRALWYRRRFGLAPAVRAGLNGGPVVAGECGDARIEIVYFGDTVNTAARLEQTAKALDRWLLLPTTLADRLPGVPGWRREDLGPVMLKGRDTPVTLCAFEPEAEAAPAPAPGRAAAAA
ncbi:adenylate/guanylate cyclase domain-containing protein [Roseospira goensis]|uniref:Adenylate cyclase n=1 Tax=Roseospira goensis TaxID=391922 RepID=A0A7W6S2N6_9PROT|nr:adenylate/guanylate cyclase domain-containing protein [Roseospira goensis]MBB4287719.1 adenylate cyclase [Roseospira goensis]